MESARERVEPAERTAPCPRDCGNEVTWSAVNVGTEERPKWLPPGTPVCEPCQEAEAEAEQEEARRRAEEERTDLQETRQAEMLPLLEALGVNVRENGHCTLDEWDTTHAGEGPVEAARDFVRNTREAGRYEPVTGLYVHGTTGNGKTQLLVCIIRELLSDPLWEPDSIVYDRADSLIGQVQATYGGEGSERAVVERRVEAPVWILDDLGTEKVSADVGRVFTEIISRRALHPTAIASNLTREAWESRDDGLARIGSRLGPQYFQAVEVRGPDRRWS